MSEKNEEELQFMANQLRKPFGEKASFVGEKMDVGNVPLFELTLESMDIQNGDRILEIGFGTGRYLKRLFDRAEELEVHGIDYSKEMVKIASELNESLLEEGKINLEWGSSEDLPFDDESFDKVYCNMVVYFWDEPANHLEEVRRVLQPEGSFYTGLRTKESMLQLPFVEYGFNLYGKDEWTTVLENNGFRVTGIQQKSDPPVEIDTQKLKLESLCITAEKNE